MTPATVVPPRPEGRLAAAPPPRASGEADDWTAHDAPDDLWHIATTVIRLRDGTRAYLHAVIDNVSRRILAWRVADTCAPVTSVTGQLDASRAGAPADTAPVVVADAGVEHLNAQVDELMHTGVLRRLLAFTERQCSNSLIEAW